MNRHHPINVSALRLAVQATERPIQELAKECGVSRRGLTRWLSGETRQIAPAHLSQLAKTLGVSINSLRLNYGVSPSSSERAALSHLVNSIAALREGLRFEKTPSLPAKMLVALQTCIRPELAPALENEFLFLLFRQARLKELESLLTFSQSQGRWSPWHEYLSLLVAIHDSRPKKVRASAILLFSQFHAAPESLSPQILRGLANFSRKVGDFEMSLALLKQCRRSASHEEEALVQLGLAYSFMGLRLYSKARESLSRCRTSLPQVNREKRGASLLLRFLRDPRPTFARLSRERLLRESEIRLVSPHPWTTLYALRSNTNKGGLALPPFWAKLNSYDQLELLIWIANTNKTSSVSSLLSKKLTELGLPITPSQRVYRR